MLTLTFRNVQFIICMNSMHVGNVSVMSDHTATREVSCMEWNQLHYFQTVARLQHFTRAAETLSISQPALSRSIARLEEELGVPLFERQGRAVSLNRYGEIFLKRVHRALQEIAEGQQEIQDLVDPAHGSISLGFIHSQGSNLVPDLLGLFRKSSPHIGVKLYQNSQGSLLEQLRDGEIDFCFCSAPDSSEGVQWVELLTEELFAIVPTEHRLASRSSIALSELAGDPFILVKKETHGLRDITDRLCQEAGFVPHVTFEGEELGTITAFVAAKLGVALIPPVKGLDMTKISRLPITEPCCQRVIGMAWMEGRYLSPAAKRFRQFVLEHYEKETP
jgi:DNA-binding transcriptional LysR family regulator